MKGRLWLVSRIGMVLALLSWPPPPATLKTIALLGNPDTKRWPGDARVTIATTASAAGPFDLPHSFMVRGTGAFSVEDADIRGTFELAYAVHADGRVTFTRLQAEVDPAGVLILRIPILRDRRVPLFCAGAGNVGLINGFVDPTGKLTIPTGAATVVGNTFSEPGPFPRGCPGRGNVGFFSATNNDMLIGRHDPARNEFHLEGRFRTSREGRDFTIRVSIAGSFVNRPPRAVIGVRGAGVSPVLGQGGCPPLKGGNPPTTEANDPEGLRVSLVSASFDPDGPWGRADLSLEQWSHARGREPFRFLGQGREIGPVLFEFGSEHRLLLAVTDQAGADSRDNCLFTVADTTPPLVIPPSRLTTACSEPGGASLRTSRALRDFLRGAVARDNSDPTPQPLTPQLLGKDINESTLFPVNRPQSPDSPSYLPVEFRFRDRLGNVGSGRSSVWVVDRQPPSLRVELSPNMLSPTLQFVTIRADILAADVCTGVRVRLASIQSNVPAQDPNDIQDAQVGTDDREFRVRAAPAVGANQQLMDRIYMITYVAVDELGNETRAVAQVTVKATGQ